MFLYCLFIAGSMENDGIHNATDDCALCKAWSKKRSNQEISKVVLRF